MPSIRAQKKRRRLRREYMHWLGKCAQALGVLTSSNEFMRDRYWRLRETILGRSRPHDPIAYWYVDGKLTRFHPPKKQLQADLFVGKLGDPKDSFQIPDPKNSSQTKLLVDLAMANHLDFIARIFRPKDVITFKGIPFGMGNNAGVRVQVLFYTSENEPSPEQRRDIEEKVRDLFYVACRVLERPAWNKGPCPDCGCPYDVICREGPCCEFEYMRAINPSPRRRPAV